ncbi:hypothetical protein [Streptomyces sp. NPDC048256]|uniref:hypothetical protein n=1 Tax=Streptomyces sp. NPDC048256 TaxID=3154613 RepID=UPI0033E2513A
MGHGAQQGPGGVPVEEQALPNQFGRRADDGQGENHASVGERLDSGADRPFGSLGQSRMDAAIVMLEVSSTVDGYWLARDALVLRMSGIRFCIALEHLDDMRWVS